MPTMITRNKYQLARLVRELKLRPLTITIYWFVFFTLKFLILICSFTKVRVYPRNSLVIGYLEPGISDIDLTILLPKSHSNHQYQMVRFIVSTLKIIFPIIGEIQWIKKSEIKLILSFLNSFEKEKSPFLESWFIENKKIASQIEKIIYFLKMLETNLHDLENYPELRRRKWEFHAKQLGLKVPNPFHLKGLIEVANEHFSEKLVENALRFLLMKRTQPDISDQEITPLQYALFFNRLCYLKPEFKLTQLEQALLKANLNWELASILTYLNFEKPHNLTSHIETLKQSAIRYLDPSLLNETLPCFAIIEGQKAGP